LSILLTIQTHHSTYCHNSVSCKNHVPHTLLEWSAQGALIVRERHGEFEAR
jgi:hypothetical protein